MTDQPTQVLIDVDTLKRWLELTGYIGGSERREAMRAELAALIPADPMAKAREVWKAACAADDNTENTTPVAVIHDALNEPRPMTPEIASALAATRELHPSVHFTLADQFQPARKGDEA